MRDERMIDREYRETELMMVDREYISGVENGRQGYRERGREKGGALTCPSPVPPVSLKVYRPGGCPAAG